MDTSDTDIAPVESPCINICSLDEICAWREASETERREILQRAEARGQAVRRA